MSQFLYVLQVTRPAMLTEGPNEHERKVLFEHFAHLQKLMEDGVLILAGRTQTTHPETMGLAIFNASSMDEAVKIKNSDPVIINGVMTAEVYPYQIAMIDEGNVPVEPSQN
jgi:uncharacterized protein